MKKIILKLINNEKSSRSLMFKACGLADYCGCEATQDICPCEGDCSREFCLGKYD